MGLTNRRGFIGSIGAALGAWAATPLLGKPKAPATPLPKHTVMADQLMTTVRHGMPSTRWRDV